MKRFLLLALLLFALPALAQTAWVEGLSASRAVAKGDQTMEFSWAAAQVVTSSILDATECAESGVSTLSVSAGSGSDYRVLACDAKMGPTINCSPISGMPTSGSFTGRLLNSSYVQMNVRLGGATAGFVRVDCLNTDGVRWDSAANAWVGMTGAGWRTYRYTVGDVPASGVLPISFDFRQCSSGVSVQPDSESWQAVTPWSCPTTTYSASACRQLSPWPLDGINPMRRRLNAANAAHLFLVVNQAPDPGVTAAVNVGCPL